jgi:hypothetical protein
MLGRLCLHSDIPLTSPVRHRYFVAHFQDFFHLFSLMLNPAQFKEPQT